MYSQFLCVAEKCDINQIDCNGNTVLHQACYSGKVEMVESLLARHVNLDKRNSSNDTALVFAANRNSGACVKAILRAIIRTDNVNILRSWTDFANLRNPNNGDDGRLPIVTVDMVDKAIVHAPDQVVIDFVLENRDQCRF